MKNFKIFQGENPNVWKYVFEKEDAIAEAVLYRYGNFEGRTVICCSVQSGCPVGCIMCGTGKRFIRNLNCLEIVQQIETIIEDQDINPKKCKKFQIMFMSMGEPMLNWKNVEFAIEELHKRYPKSQLLISTIGIDDDKTFGDMILLSKEIKNIGLQFSIHAAFDYRRDEIIPYKNKMDLRKIRDVGIVWNAVTKRPVFLNYCPRDEVFEDSFEDNCNRLKDLFSPTIFNFTFSVLCESKEGKQTKENINLVNEYAREFIRDGYNTRIFNPAGKDDIGGGCGQLWYVQEWLKNRKV